MCGCLKGRGEDRGITSVVEEGLGTDVCLCEGLRWRSKYVSWSDGKVNMVCDGWGALMWSLTADIMAITGNPSVNTGPEDSSTPISPACCRADM